MTLTLTPPETGRGGPDEVQGPAGRIELAWTLPSGPTRGLALVTHPHPLHGGALSNKVAYTLASAAAAQGYLALRFNFRGVGRSEGRHDHGIGETDDAVLLAQALQRLAPDQPLLLLGFSFGAFIQLRVAERVACAGVLTVAPPLGRYLDLPAPARPSAAWWVLHSRDDTVVDFAETERLLADYRPTPRLVAVDGAGHFFHGRLDEVRDAVCGLVADLGG